MSAPVAFGSSDCCPNPCADGPSNQVPGPAGTNGSVWRSGFGVPANNLGVDSDFYIDANNGNIYNKLAGVYVFQLTVYGKNAYTLLTANFTVPAVAASVTVAVVNSSWAVNGEDAFVGTAGYYAVVGIPDQLHVTLQNRGYPGNAAPGVVIAFPQVISPSGLRGAAGAATSTTLNDLSPTTSKGDLIVDNGALNPNASDVRLAVGSNGKALLADSTQPTGLRWGGIDLTGVNTALTGSLPVANGGTAGTTAATARTGIGAAASGLATASGLTSSATDKVIGRSTAGAGAVEEIACTAFGRSVIAAATAAAARTVLGVICGDYLLYQHQQFSGVDGGTFTNGAWRTVPITTEVVDTNNNGSLAANIMTLATGTYRFRAWVNGYAVANMQARLFNVDTTSVIAYGRCSVAVAGTGVSLIDGRFTIGSPTQVRLEAQCSVTEASDGFGKALGFGTEVYDSIEFFKES